MFVHSHILTQARKVLPLFIKRSIISCYSTSTNNIVKEYDSITQRGKNREAINYHVGDCIDGFECIKVRPVPELNITAYQFKHKNTQADYIHLDTADTDNVFSVTFRTPCTNSTGVSHILEHTTLCGSEKYPVHDPFMKMRKRSLQTFMNAMTFDDHTCFPVSSTIPRDLLNLMDVYCDSVFFPLLRLQDFRQEGWRLENNQIQGVVYNEMKGYEADPVRSYYRAISSSYLKNTNYQYISGGSPLCIPSLQYEDLLTFHHTHYHPSNCLFYTYGDIHPSHHIHYLNTHVLSRFSFNPQSQAIQVSTLPNEALHAKEQHESFTCPSDNDPEHLKNHYMKIFPMNLTTDSTDIIKLQLLSLLLFKGQASPFYKSLIEDHLFSSFSPLQGYNTFSKNAFFVIGGCEMNKNVSEEDIDKVIIKTLQQVCKDGFDERRIQGILNEVQFGYKQIKSHYGLTIMQSVIEAWTHEADPTVCLFSEEQLKAIQQEGVNKVMKQMIEKYLLPTTSNNGIKHIHIHEDNQYFDKMNIEEEKNRQELIKKYSNGLPTYTEAINPHLYAKEVNDSVLPTLTIENIPKEHKIPSATIYQSSPSIPRIYTVETTTNGIVYPRLFFSLQHHTYRDFLNLPILTFLMNIVDSDSLSASELEIQESQYCGGIQIGVSCYNQFKGDSLTYKNIAYISSSILMQNQNLEKVTSIFEHRLKNHSLIKSLPRIQTFLQSLITESQLDVTNSLSSYNSHRARARDSIVSFINDCYFGYQHYQHLLSLQPIVNDLDRLKEYIESELQPLLYKTFNQENMEVFMTSDQEHMKEMHLWSEQAKKLVNPQEKEYTSVIGKLDQDGFIHSTKEQFLSLRNEVPGSLGEYYKSTKNLFTRSGIITNHVLSTYPSIASTSYHFDGVHILSEILSSNYLLKHVREEGGAYGVGCTHDDGRMVFSSYDDPNVLRTIDQFVTGCKWLKEKNYSSKDIQEARLSIFSEIDSPTVPQSLGVGEVFSGKTSEKRQAQRDCLLELTEEELHEVALKAFDCDASKMKTCVFGNATSVKEVENDPNWIIDELALS